MTDPGHAFLADPLLAEILHIADGPGVRAIAIVGSAARGEATAWSDVDVDRFVATEGERGAGPDPRFIGDRLVMFSTEALETIERDLRDPERAIWVVPALRDMRILLDREGSARSVQERARTFDWEALREPAGRAACRRLVYGIEYLYKIRSAIDRSDASSALHATGSLHGRCVRAVVAAKLVQVPSENDYFRIAEEAAGPEWRRAHRRVLGLSDEGPVAMSEFDQARAAVALYRLTVRLLDEVLDAGSRALIQRATAIVPPDWQT